MSSLTKAQLLAENQTNFPNNTTGYISPLLLRNYNIDSVDSTVNQAAYTTDSSSVSAQLVGLNSYTQSLNTNFITSASLNASTQSLSASLAPNINNKTYTSSFNSFTQSTNGRLDTIETNYASKNAVNTFTQNNTFQYDVSVGRNLGVTNNLSVTGSLSGSGLSIVGNSILGGNAFGSSSFNGFVFFNNPEKVYFGSTQWNYYSSSIGILQTSASVFPTFSSSVNSRVTALENWSTSLDATYATDAQLNYSSSTLQANINQKLDTSSFNTYTASATLSISGAVFFSSSQYKNDSSSFDSRITSNSSSLSSLSSSVYTTSASNSSRLNTIEATYAKTGSNTFTDTQTITGSANKLLIGNNASTTTYPAATVIVSNVSSSDVENHNIGIVGAGLATSASTSTPLTGWGVGGYFKGWTNGTTRAGGVIGEGMVNVSTDAGAAIGVRGYSNQIHSGGSNIGLYGDASGSSVSNYALYMNRGNIYSNVAQTWTLASSTAALNIGNLINLDTTTNTITFSGSVNVTGQYTSGSSYSNVVIVTPTSNTASIDMSKGNFFTLTIPSSSITLIKATNIQQGQTVGVKLLQQSTTGSVRFDSTFKFWSGSAAYNTGSALSGAVDLFTFITFDTGSLWTSIVKNLV